MITLLPRRTCLKLLTTCAVGAHLASYSYLSTSAYAAAEVDDQMIKPEDLERWMNAWMSTTMAPGGSLHVTRFKDPIYILTKPITWTPNPGQEAFGEVTVPKGFVTDFTSIPRAFWSLLRPDGDYTYPAIVHDYLYWTQERTREDSDDIFKFGMEDFEINQATITTIYAAVRRLGGFAWEGNSDLKKDGERRVLKKFPQDPRITWEEWKHREGVF